MLVNMRQPQKSLVIAFHGPCHPCGHLGPFLSLDSLRLLGVGQRQTSFALGPEQHGWQGSCEVQLPPLALLHSPDRDKAASDHPPCSAALDAAVQRPHQKQAQTDCLHKANTFSAPSMLYVLPQHSSVWM